MSESIDPLADLVEERAVERQIIGVARAMDERDWDALAAILAPDVTADLGGGRLVGVDAVIGRIRHFLDRCGPSQHMVGTILVDVDRGSGTASSRAYLNDRHVGTGERADLSFATLGDYHDTWEKRDGVWRLASRVKHSRAVVGTRDVFDGAW